MGYFSKPLATIIDIRRLFTGHAVIRTFVGEADIVPSEKSGQHVEGAAVAKIGCERLEQPETEGTIINIFAIANGGVKASFKLVTGC